MELLESKLADSLHAGQLKIILRSSVPVVKVDLSWLNIRELRYLLTLQYENIIGALERLFEK